MYQQKMLQKNEIVIWKTEVESSKITEKIILKLRVG